MSGECHKCGEHALECVCDNKIKWISDSEIVVGNKVYHCTNPKWIKRLMGNLAGDPGLMEREWVSKEEAKGFLPDNETT